MSCGLIGEGSSPSVTTNKETMTNMISSLEQCMMLDTLSDDFTQVVNKTERELKELSQSIISLEDKLTNVLSSDKHLLQQYCLINSKILDIIEFLTSGILDEISLIKGESDELLPMMVSVETDSQDYIK